ncbi:outer membrane protein [Deminuibacter soli]|uniref:Outer membrane protein beta-barrel domain-containing protein n=1 Tax=Deminuibacter soli TaxID=2291815 RepID=A0A3E1NPQ8_9BACT|nr:outer membrane beta-barrel protein [Deminuibacter soli]RFM29929.1 hypothetical protein DXN05_02840 [Deminuibacter soli]
MKQLLSVLLVLYLCTTASLAQISKGTLLVGGNLDLTKSNYSPALDSFSYKQIGITPAIGFAYSDNRVWGISLQYAYTDSRYDGGKSNTYGAGLFLRQYKPLGHGFNLLFHESAGISYTKLDISNRSDNIKTGINKTTVFNVAAALGITYALTPRWQLELLLNNLLRLYFASDKDAVLNTDGSTAYTVKSNRYQINTGLNDSNLGSLSFGVKFLLGGK